MSPIRTGRVGSVLLPYVIVTPLQVAAGVVGVGVLVGVRVAVGLLTGVFVGGTGVLVLQVASGTQESEAPQPLGVQVKKICL